MAGGWIGSRRRDELPSNWLKLRALVRRRAGGRCEAALSNGQRCPNKGTDCDHIVRGSDHTLTNLQWLCRVHHSRKTSREGIAAKKRAPRRRPDERHPGKIN